MKSTARAEIVKIASQIVSGKDPILDGVRRIVALRFDLDNPDDEAFLTLRGYASETDEFPSKSVRKDYDKAALQKLDAELAEYDSRAREIVFESCRELIKKFS